MITKLSDGFEVVVKDNHLNDWHLLKLLRGIDKGDTALIVDVLEILIGEEEAEKLAGHLEKDGVTTIDSMVGAMSEIMEAAKDLKNSPPSPA